MDLSRNLDIKKLPSVDLNDIHKSYHDGVYTFTKDKAKINKNFPANDIAGFLFVSTDFDETLCVQKITTMGKNFYYRTGTKVSNVFEWSEWDRYASLEDVPAKSIEELDKDFITKEEYFPKSTEGLDIHMLGAYDFQTGKDYWYDAKLQTHGILQRVYKYYGELPEYIAPHKLPEYLHSHGFMKNRSKAFLLGYFIRENTLLEDQKDGQPNRWPTKNPGLLQVFSSLGKRQKPNSVQLMRKDPIYPPSGDIDPATRINTTLIFHDFITGDIYLSRIADWSHDATEMVPNRDVYNPSSNFDSYSMSELQWDKFNMDPKITYDRNKKGIDLLKFKSILAPIKVSGLNVGSNEVNATRSIDYLNNRDYLNFSNLSKVYSWKDESKLNIKNDTLGLPFFYSTMTDNDYTLISSMFFNGTFSQKSNIEVQQKYNRIYVHNFQTTPYFTFPVFNTFNISYTTIKIAKNKYKNIDIEKVNT